MCYVFVDDRSSLEESVSEAISFLNQSSEVSSDVEIAWKLTHTARRHIILDLSISTNDYLNQFPSLTQPNGFKLAALDAYLLHPQKLHFIELWGKVYEYILEKYIKSKEREGNKYIKILNTESEFFFNINCYSLKLI